MFRLSTYKLRVSYVCAVWKPCVPSGTVWDTCSLGAYWVNPSDLGVTYVWDTNVAVCTGIPRLGSIKMVPCVPVCSVEVGLCRTRSTQRAQTSLAEADHCSHIAHCKNVEPWLWKTTPPLKKGSGSLPAPRSGYPTTIRVFFAHLLLTIPRSPPKFNQFFLLLLRTPP